MDSDFAICADLPAAAANNSAPVPDSSYSDEWDDEYDWDDYPDDDEDIADDIWAGAISAVWSPQTAPTEHRY